MSKSVLTISLHAHNDHTYSLRLNELKEEVGIACGDKIYKIMSGKILLKILIFSVWMSLAIDSWQSDKVV